jgi:hypothetical protein
MGSAQPAQEEQGGRRMIFGLLFWGNVAAAWGLHSYFNLALAVLLALMKIYVTSVYPWRRARRQRRAAR